MLINRDYTQPYYANADTKAQISAKCAKLKARSITKLSNLNNSDLGQSVKHALKLYIELVFVLFWFVFCFVFFFNFIACTFLRVSAFTHYSLISLITKFRRNVQAKFS